jgi:hypothetical protein
MNLLRHSRDTSPIQNMPRKREIVETLRRIFPFQPLGNPPRAQMQKAQQEMTSVKAALLSFAMLSAIVLSGLGTYAGDAANNHNVVDGYGVTAALR